MEMSKMASIDCLFEYLVYTMALVRNYNVQINHFDNYSSNSIICDDLKQKNLHNYLISE